MVFGKKKEAKMKENALESVDLENEINTVINNCKSIIKSNKIINKKSDNKKNVENNVASTVTLEQVAEDMSNVLVGLKSQLQEIGKKKKDSFSDVNQQLETIFQKQSINQNPINKKTTNKSVANKNKSNINNNDKANNNNNTDKVNNNNKDQAKKENTDNNKVLNTIQKVKNCITNYVKDNSISYVQDSNINNAKDSSISKVKDSNINNVKDDNINKMKDIKNVKDSNITTVKDNNINNVKDNNINKPKDNNINNVKVNNISKVKESSINNVKNININKTKDDNINKAKDIKNVKNNNITKVKDSNINNVKENNINKAKNNNINNVKVNNISKVKDSNTNQLKNSNISKGPVQKENINKTVINATTKTENQSAVRENSANRKIPNSATSSVSKNSASPSHQPTPNAPVIHIVNIDTKLNEAENLTGLKEQIKVATNQRKTFTIQGRFEPIRQALLSRGWVEKFHPSYRPNRKDNFQRFRQFSILELVNLMREKQNAAICKKLILSKLLENHQVDLWYGTNYRAFVENSDKVKITMINKFRRGVGSYTSKQGLCESASRAYWYQIPGVASMNHPRTYGLVKNGDTSGFIADYHITAAMSLLKWVVKNSVTHECSIISPAGKIPLRIFDFAVNECYKFVKRAKHDDIDNEINEALEIEWSEFLDQYYQTVHVGNHFKKDGNTTENIMLRKSNFILKKLKKFWPYMEMDGLMNIWILKPTNSSQGQGIHVCRSLKYILDVVKENSTRRYIIQKYIERPLLIYNTKFDIRQWFLISNSSPLTIWIYKDSYLRFSSQTYNLRKLHESIHLTNNSVQVKYNKNTKDVALPSYNMWDSQQFKNFLSNIGFPNAYKDVIYPGMKQCIIAAVLMHQDKIDTRRNCFELYGADFMLTEDFTPWLLEINACPALHASTPVTSRMCPKVLHDVIRVVVDYNKNARASTGLFELMYKEKLAKLPNITGINLELIGTPIKPGYFSSLPGEVWHEKSSTVSSLEDNPEIEKAKESLQKVTEGMKNSLQNLLKLVKNERSRRQSLKTIGTIVSQESLIA